MDLAARLADAPSPTMTLLPDGSVDRRYGVLDRENAPASREAFVEQLSGGQRSFVTEHRGVEPGGQAVNAAIQARELGADVDLYGHLDHEVFGVLDADTASMGAPASVNVYEFEDSAVMFTTESADIRSWTYDDLAAAGGDAALDADAVVWTNWASFPNATDALLRAADRPGDGGVFVLDPGGVTARTAAERAAFVDALGALADRYSVVVSANAEELGSIASTVGVEGSVVEQVRELRDLAGITGVVMHGERRAVAGTRGGVVNVPNFELAGVSRFTGGGDRFSGALGFARACGWAWEPSLWLANACASYYIGTGLTGDRTAIGTYSAETTALAGESRND
ncbi:MULTISPECIES: carbohydrate kinase family protein [Halobacterium]|uniref:carbohydrate kinase family protein n=1 Tax=Halobacterium TaxID=2239 RepID=UPI00073EC6B1|nr:MULTISPECIES: carbohydrate kinase family protein [Halobacterium]MCG1002704.1 carbohydrate kinase family protein [Halobacterium noricense]